jgi:CheY-like chemotaxis protein
MPTPTPNYKAMRRNYLVNRRLQFKYAFLISGVLATVLVLMEAHVFLVIRMVEPEFMNPVLLEPLRSLQGWMLASGLIFMVVIPILSIFVSHKIAGPLFRFEKTLRDALQSEGPIPPIRLRQGDELQSLADLINQLLERLPKKNNPWNNFDRGVFGWYHLILMAKILIVDDEKETVELLRLVLEKDQHQILTALSGEEALKSLKQQAPDLILLDVTMPGMDGYTLMTNIQSEEATRDIPVMVLTGRENMRDTFEMFRNVVDFVSKPFDIKELRARVQVALQKA